MSFEDHLSRGEFLIPKCTRCKKIVWPPSDYCNQCFGKIKLKKRKFKAKIVEFSKENEDYFCLVEIEDAFRIIAKTRHTPAIGRTVSISKCGIKDTDYFFEITLDTKNVQA